MEHKITRSTYLAQVISKLTNPCILSVLTLLLIACTESSNVRELVSWTVIILLFFVLIPLVYLYLRTSKSGHRIKSVFELTIFLKQHPWVIMILAMVLGLPCLAILWFVKAPAILISALVALITCSIVIALFNLLYRVSFHLAAITLLVIIAAHAWGQIFLALLVSIPPIAWAKYEIRDHTIPQLIMGTALGAIVSLATVYLFG